MRPSVLTKVFKGKIWLQFIFGLFPVYFTLFYVILYCVDVFGLFSIIINNDMIVGREIRGRTINKVLEINESKDKLLVEGLESITLDVPEGKMIYYIELLSESEFRVVTNEGDLYCDSLDIIDSVKYDKSKQEYILTVLGETVRLHGNNVACKVYLLDALKFRVDIFKEGNTHSVEVNSIPNIECLGSGDEDGYVKLKITTNHTVDLVDSDINFCTELPDDSLYYSSAYKGYVKNISDDFAMMYIIDSNCLVLLVCMVIYIILVKIAGSFDKFEILSSGYCIISNIIGILLLPFIMFLTFIMFR